MRYVLADPHGEYGLFRELLKSVCFGAEDELYICGDIIDKGKESIRLLQYVFEHPNMHCILGNHEFFFLQYYHSLMDASPENFYGVLEKLRSYFPEDGYLLDWKTIDRLEQLPTYIETEDFICVHAGLTVEPDGCLTELAQCDDMILLHDRRFKEADVVHSSPKCVFFGHTETACISGEQKVLAYRRHGSNTHSMRDFYKVHLDTGAWHSGTMALFCIDTCRIHYVRKKHKA